MLGAGWPNAVEYTERLGLSYNDREHAKQMYMGMLVELTAIAADGDDKLITARNLVALGPTASKNVPRALSLIEWIDEGGTTVELPSSLTDWPTTEEDYRARSRT